MEGNGTEVGLWAWQQSHLGRGGKEGEEGGRGGEEKERRGQGEKGKKGEERGRREGGEGEGERSVNSQWKTPVQFSLTRIFN